MKIQILFLAILFLAICTFSLAQPINAEKDIPVFADLPDLAFGKYQMLRNGNIEITIVNKGKAKSGVTEGGYSCGYTLSGYKFSSGVMFIINELKPNATQKMVLDCHKAKILGASLDGKNKVKESNEKNNTIKFANP